MRALLHPVAAALGAAAVLVAAGGCGIRKAMYDQPKNKTLSASEFFADGRSARDPVEGTVARGHLREDAHLYAGLVDGKPAETFPFPVTEAVLRRGEARFNIYCSPCHDRAGTGAGMVPQRGFKTPPSYHQDRLRQAPPGYFFDVITKGFGVMPPYAAQVKPEDRWAIAAYIRVLQISQNAAIEDLPPAEQEKLKAL